MHRTYSRILSTYFLSGRFFGASLFFLFAFLVFAPVLLFPAPIAPIGDEDGAFRFAFVYIAIIGGICLGLTLGLQLKALTAYSISATLPDGRFAPLAAFCGVACAYMLIVMFVGLHHHLSPYGIFSFTLVTLAFWMLIGFWQGGYLLAAPFIFYIFVHVPQFYFFLLIFKGYELYASAWLVIGLALLALLSRLALTLSEDGVDHAGKRLAGKAPSSSLEPRTRKPNWLLRLSLAFYPEKHPRPAALSRPYARIAYWQSALNPRYNPLYYTLLMLIVSLGFTGLVELQNFLLGVWNEKQYAVPVSYADVTFFINYVPAYLALLLLREKQRYRALEFALPFSRREYVLTQGGAMLLAIYRLWAHLAIAGILLVACLATHVLGQPDFWVEIASSAFVVLFFFGLINAVTAYNRNYAVFLTITIFIAVEMSLHSVFSHMHFLLLYPQQMDWAFSAAHLGIGVTLTWVAYRKWLDRDFTMAEVDLLSN